VIETNRQNTETLCEGTGSERSITVDGIVVALQTKVKRKEAESDGVKNLHHRAANSRGSSTEVQTISGQTVVSLRRLVESRKARSC
jgi:hypothetical protein